MVDRISSDYHLREWRSHRVVIVTRAEEACLVIPDPPKVEGATGHPMSFWIANKYLENTPENG